MRVECSVEEVEIENDNGHPIGSVRVTCLECDHCEESFGTSERSINRCFILFKQNCPKGEKNYYVVKASG